MAAITARGFDAPDETRSPDNALVEVIDLDSAKVARMTLRAGLAVVGIGEAGGRDRRTAGLATSDLALSGRIHVVHEDGTECDIGPGEAYVIEPGHDAWVVGDESSGRLRVRERHRERSSPPIG